MRALDLFSGIGGFALALHGVSRTVAYCETDPKCVRVLQANMARRALTPAPIFPDVTALGARELAPLAPELITAGFPCQDISCLTAGAKGLDGPRSRLFFQVPRIAAACPSVQHAFLENSPCISRRGLPRVLRSLRAAGFSHAAYGVFAASDVGAPHQRRRWFCLASKAPQRLARYAGEHVMRGKVQEARWRDSDLRARVIPRPQHQRDRRALLDRCLLLGNAVVPQCAAFAFANLAAALTGPDADPTAPTPSARPPSGSSLCAGAALTIVRPSRRGPSCAARPHPGPLQTRRTSLVLRDDHGHVVTRAAWCTPTHTRSSFEQSRVMSRRALWTLSNLIFYEQGTRCPASPTIADRSRFYSVNPVFYERIMGFPDGWTAALSEHSHTLRRSAPRAPTP